MRQARSLGVLFLGERRVSMFSRFLTRLFSRDEEGAAVGEYAVALFLVAVITIAIISFLGGSISTFFQSAASSI